MIKNKKISAVIAIILVFAMLLTGTFAWQSISQQALNQAIVLPPQAGGRLHDDFQDMGDNFGMNTWQALMTANKDVYIENFEDAWVRNPLFDPNDFDPLATDGSSADMWARDENDNRIPGSGRDIFVRVQLREFMQIGEGVRDHAFGDIDDPRASQTWGVESGGTFDTWEPGADRTDPMTWAVRTYARNVPANNDMADFWQWNFGGEGNCPGYKWFMPTFNRDHQSRESDTKGAGISYRLLETGEVTNRTNPNGAASFDPDAGNDTDFWRPSDPLDPTTFDTHEELYKYWDSDLEVHAMSTSPRLHVAQPTLTSEGVITMTQWLALSPVDQIGEFWVWDEDGWFYWAAPLPAGQATGLLLSSITLLQDTTEEMYYAIFVDAEMATATHWDAAFVNRSPEAEELLERISGSTSMAQDARAMIANTAVGNTFTYNGYEWRVLARDGEDVLIIWEHATAAGFQYNLANDYSRLGDSNLRNHLDDWAATRLTVGLRGIILEADNVDNDVRLDWDDPAPHPPNSATPATHPAAFTTPGAATTTAAQANENVFILSRSEAMYYFDNDADRIAFSDLDDSIARAWWLRSPGTTDTAPSNIIAASGATSGNPANGSIAMRPAMWVSTAP